MARYRFSKGSKFIILVFDCIATWVWWKLITPMLVAVAITPLDIIFVAWLTLTWVGFLLYPFAALLAGQIMGSTDPDSTVDHISKGFIYLFFPMVVFIPILLAGPVSVILMFIFAIL